MDPDCISLEEHLAPAKAYLDPFDLGGLRYHWRKSTILDCNWKVALEAFNEGYHVQTTHSQMLRYFDDWTQSYARGRHAHFGYWEAMPMGSRSPRLTGGEPTEDIRPGIRDYMEDMAETLNAGSSVQTVHAARRVMQEVEPGASHMEVLMKFGQFIYEHAISLGLKWPDITPQQMQEAGIDWHLVDAVHLIFHRILHRDELPVGLVHVVQATVKGSRFSRAGRARYKNDSVFSMDQLIDMLDSLSIKSQNCYQRQSHDKVKAYAFRIQ
jgi:hypothetical protein